MNVLPQKLECFVLTWAAGFFDEHSEAIEIGPNLVGRKKLRPRSKDGSLNNRVFRAVEAEEFAKRAAVNNASDDFGAIVTVIERFNAESVPAAGVCEDWAINGFNGQKPC